MDATVSTDEDRLEEFVAAGAAFGLVPRIDDAIKFARQRRVLLLRHQPSALGVDVSLAAMPFEEEAIARAIIIDFEGVAVPVASPEDLLIMKAVAGRPKDLDDMLAVLDAHPDVDLARVRYWLEQFAEVLEEPELVTRFEGLLAARQ